MRRVLDLLGAVAVAGVLVVVVWAVIHLVPPMWLELTR